jgi:GNAT superfamily N-acetyltransferase
MDEGRRYRLMDPGEEEQVCALVTAVFRSYVAPGFPPEGVQAFLDYVQPEALLARSLGGHFVLVAEVDGRIVGAIEVRDEEHISLLFVDRSHQRRGIGRELVRRALRVCGAVGLPPSQISVNSSLFAVPFYESLGFRPTSAPQVRDGIHYVPMVLASGSGPPGSQDDAGPLSEER